MGAAIRARPSPPAFVAKATGSRSVRKPDRSTQRALSHAVAPGEDASSAADRTGPRDRPCDRPRREFEALNGLSGSTRASRACNGAAQAHGKRDRAGGARQLVGSSLRRRRTSTHGSPKTSTRSRPRPKRTASQLGRAAALRASGLLHDGWRTPTSPRPDFTRRQRAFGSGSISHTRSHGCALEPGETILMGRRQASSGFPTAAMPARICGRVPEVRG